MGAGVQEHFLIRPFVHFLKFYCNSSLRDLWAMVLDLDGASRPVVTRHAKVSSRSSNVLVTSVYHVRCRIYL
jgi:hypothetical protein